MAILGKPYTLADFDKLIFSESTYVLSKSIFDIFKTIEQNIDVSSFSATTTSTHSYPAKRDDNYYGNSNGYASKDHSSKPAYSSSKPNTKHSGSSGRTHNKKETHSTEDWGLMRSFKTTKIETKTGVDKTINDIRIHLNKMSTTNYAKQRDTIISEIRQYLESEMVSSENTSKISLAIFQIASSNKFLSELYSNLYVELICEFPLFGDLLNEFVSSFHETVDTIEYIDPEENYDEFCRITKANDKRKSTTTFIGNAMNKGVVQPKVVMELLLVFLDTVLKNTQEPNRINQLEEITENIFILVSVSSAVLRTLPEWKSAFGHIRLLADGDSHVGFKSTSNRIVFKFMDILDKGDFVPLTP
jgi:hypothetical protein